MRRSQLELFFAVVFITEGNQLLHRLLQAWTETLSQPHTSACYKAASTKETSRQAK